MTGGLTRRSALYVGLAAVVAPAAHGTERAERRETARRLADVVSREYQDPDAARALAEAIRARAFRGAYDDVASDEAFADMLTADLRAVVPDKHMAVAANVPAGTPDLSEDPVFALRQNYGLQAVRRLGGNVGLIELNFSPNLSVSDPILDRYAAAMALVKDTRALIVDLRAHIGGDPGTVVYFVSYFFDRDPFVVNRVRYRNKPLVEFRTVASPSGVKYGEQRPVFVLVSPDTFSAGEELAYDLQATRRAAIVGQATGGGANPNQPYELGQGFSVFVPVGAVVNPVTGRNWEGVGVKPDVQSEPGRALDFAWRLALDAALAQAMSEDERASIGQAIAALPK